MLRYWFVPCWSGDFRLEAKTDEEGGHCVLTVENPTAQDKTKLAPFLAECRKRGLLDDLTGIAPTGVTTIRLQERIDVLGPVLADCSMPGAKVWTAVRCSDGQVILEDGSSLPAVTKKGKKGKGIVEQAKDAVTSLVKSVPALPELPAVLPEAAVTVPKPARGCPPPTSCTRRASEVLRTFCTGSQWRSWQANGSMRLIGNATGKAYLLYHRDEAARRGMGHVLREVAQRREVCVWDATVPPEEEALAVKFAVEHREAWMLGMTDGLALLAI